MTLARMGPRPLTASHSGESNSGEPRLSTVRWAQIPGKVISTSQFSVGTVFIHALWDTRYRPACKSRFPKSLSGGQDSQTGVRPLPD